MVLPARPVRLLLLAGLLALMLVALLSACERRPPPVADSTPRIVVLSPAAAITLRDLGLAPLIVGRHGFDIALDRSLPVCGDQAGIDYEALLRVRPTHVVIQWGARDHPPRLTDLARRHGWRIIDHNPLTLDDLMREADRLYDEFRHAAPTNGAMTEPPARPSVRMTRRLDALGRPAGSERVLMLAGLDPPAALGPGSFHHDVLVRLGGTPALSTGGPYQTLDAEDLRRLAPDLILLVLPRSPGTPPPEAPSFDSLRRRLGRLADLDLPALQRRRLVLIDDPECLTPSTAIVRFAEELARALQAAAPDTLAPHARPPGDPH